MNKLADDNSGCQEKMRIARFLAAAGLASRRRCEQLLLEHCVEINGLPVTSPACRVDPAVDQVRLDGRIVVLPRPRYLLFNKPAGVTCSSRDSHAASLIFDCLPTKFGRLFTIGRLDRESEGLIICTNDGELAQRVAHPSYGLEKVYRVFIRGKLSASGLARLQQGVVSEGEHLRPQRVSPVGVHTGKDTVTELEFVLGEGRKREIRRLCAAVGIQIVRLLRVAIGPVRDPDLGSGQWRHLTGREISALAGDGDLHGRGGCASTNRQTGN